MIRETFIESIGQIFYECEELIKTKNKDYSPPTDAFSSFRLQCVGVEVAILCEIEKKVKRINNLMRSEESVKHESMEDSIMDLINYSAILLARRKSLLPSNNASGN